MVSLLPLMVGFTGQALPISIPAGPWRAPANRQVDPPPPPPPDNWQDLIAEPGTGTPPGDVGSDPDNAGIDGRRRPGYEAPLPDKVVQENPGAVRPPPPEAFPTDQIPVPDRWRLIQSLGVVKENWLDPYHQNTLKGDRPVKPPFTTGDDWFLALNLVSDSVFEPRTFPIPVGVQTTQRPGSLDVFGKNASYVASQTFIGGISLIKGSTAYMPPVIEYRLTFAYNVNYADVPERRVLFVQPSKPSHRGDQYLGLQEAFIDYHLHNFSNRYDFISVRAGIQQFQSDFRGFLFNDNQLGIRLFGNLDNNRWQFNLAAFWRLEKDTNSGLNIWTERPRRDWVLLGNLYRQDFLFPGLTSQITAVFNSNREGRDIRIDDNGFPIRPALIGDLRPRDYDVLYLGYNVDGRLGRLNLTGSVYGAFGKTSNNFFTSRRADIRAWFGAAELSYDQDWMRFRLSGLYASGDRNPYDDVQGGFDAILENPVFAGADTSYWIRQSIPFAGGGRAINLNGRNGVLNSLRSSKEQGQSNFNNPGTMLLGAGGDFDVTPTLRLSVNANHLWFANTSNIEVLRQQGNIDKSIGWDISTAAVWRPKANQNMVLRLSAATLLPGQGFKQLFSNQNGASRYYSVLANLILSY